MMWKFEGYRDNVAVIDEHGARLTYAELRHEGRMLCQQSDGRCLVFCLCKNVLGSFVGYTAFLNGGVVLAMLICALAYLLAFGVTKPALLLDPLGGLLKNVVLIPALALLWVLADRR